MASVTITTTTAQDNRLAPAFGALLGLNGNATTPQVKAWLVQQMRRVVQDYEQTQAVRALPTPTDFDPA